MQGDTSHRSRPMTTLNRLQRVPAGSLVPGICFVPRHFWCAAPRRDKLLASKAMKSFDNVSNGLYGFFKAR